MGEGQLRVRRRRPFAGPILGLLLGLCLAGGAGPAPRLAGLPLAGDPVGEPAPAACEPVNQVDVRGPGAGFVWLAEADLAPVARILASREAPYRDFPGLDVAGRPQGVRIVLLRDLACLAELGLGRPGADWVAGVADSGAGVAAVRVERAGASIPAVATVLRHELAHLALDRATAGRAPRWLHEGYAQLASGSWEWDEAWRLRWTFLRGSGERLRGVSLDFPRDPEGARLAYQLSYTAVQTLWDLSGERGFAAFARALAAGNTEDQAFRSVFGITESQFADRWRRRIADRYGVLYTLSRVAFLWAALSLLLVWAALRRRRIKRERMEALRAADAREAALRLDVDDPQGPF